MPHLDETGVENEPKAMEYMSPAGRKGEWEAEDADFGLKEQPQAGSGAITILRHLGTSSNCNLIIIRNKAI